VGNIDGIIVGLEVGNVVGCDGTLVGIEVGKRLGSSDGIAVGEVGTPVGDIVGVIVSCVTLVISTPNPVGFTNELAFCTEKSKVFTDWEIP
jgi:hypothetical protein